MWKSGRVNDDGVLGSFSVKDTFFFREAACVSVCGVCLSRVWCAVMLVVCSTCRGGSTMHTQVFFC